MCTRLKCDFRISENTKRLFLRAFLLIFYMYIGAFIFMKIEQEPAKKRSDENRRHMEILKQSVSAVYNMTEQQFIELANALKLVSCSNMPEWSHQQAASFTLQLLTTIGYGNITPRTAAGQIVTIMYAIFGIPLTLLTLKSFGTLYNSVLKYFVAILEKCIRKKTEVTYLDFKVLFLNIVALATVIIISATVSCYQDGWKMQEGVYVWFITFTTVGFGDLIPAKMMTGFQPNALIVPGLCFMSGVVDAFVECVDGLKFDRCRGNCFCNLCCRSCCGSSDMNNAVDNVETPGNSSSDLGFEAPNGLQDENINQETTF